MASSFAAFCVLGVMDCFAVVISTCRGSSLTEKVPEREFENSGIMVLVLVLSERHPSSMI